MDIEFYQMFMPIIILLLIIFVIIIQAKRFNKVKHYFYREGNCES